MHGSGCEDCMLHRARLVCSPGGGAAVFRSFVAQEGDTEVKKEVSNFVFGSSVTEVEEPQLSPTPTIPAELSLRANVGRDTAI